MPINISFPTVSYFDKDIVDMYERTWMMIAEQWKRFSGDASVPSRMFVYPNQKHINQFETIFSTFFLVYSNNTCPTVNQLDFFYKHQEADGMIRSDYDLETFEPVVLDKSNPECINPPLFSWAEFNIYHRNGTKRRVTEVLPILVRYYEWLEEHCKDETGLYVVPHAATKMGNAPKEGAQYFVDFNCQQAINAHYVSALAGILNEKSLHFRYKQKFFALKTRINRMMWNPDVGAYCDLDRDQKQVATHSLSSYWSLLVPLTDTNKTERLISHLADPEWYKTQYPFPSIPLNAPTFSKEGNGFNGSVFPFFTFLITKGLHLNTQYEMAREFATSSLYHILETWSDSEKKVFNLWEAYSPTDSKPAVWKDNPEFPRDAFVHYAGLVTITTFIEIIIGLDISLPRKSVKWIMPSIEEMGIENLALRRNTITILSRKEKRGWEIFHDSKKLYYFTIETTDREKTLPIPSGRCSMLIDKI